MTLYMVVTADEYELPLFVGTSKEVSKFLGIKQTSLYTYMSRPRSKNYGVRDNIKIVKVEVDNDED